MPSNFSSLRSSREKLLQKLAEQAKTQDQKAGQDDRFWKMTIDQKTKLGSAVIRFLPAPQNEDLAWARTFRHAFKGPGGQWFIDNCPTTKERQCPVCKNNNELWESGVEANKALARDRKRKLQYISNVLVITDPAKPENNGKVFLFSYGQKIFDKVMDKLNPEFASDVAVNPFDLWEGADFKLRSRDQGGFVNYDKSEFAAPAPVAGGDESEMEKLWLAEKSLAEFVDDKAFKSYEDLEKKLTGVLTGTGRPKTAEDAIKQEQTGYKRIENPTPTDAAEVAKALETDEDGEEAQEEKPKPTTRGRARSTKAPAEKPAAKVETPADDDEIRSFFAELEG